MMEYRPSIYLILAHGLNGNKDYILKSEVNMMFSFNMIRRMSMKMKKPGWRTSGETLAPN